MQPLHLEATREEELDKLPLSVEDVLVMQQ